MANSVLLQCSLFKRNIQVLIRAGFTYTSLQSFLLSDSNSWQSDLLLKTTEWVLFLASSTSSHFMLTKFYFLVDLVSFFQLIYSSHLKWLAIATFVISYVLIVIKVVLMLCKYYLVVTVTIWVTLAVQNLCRWWLLKQDSEREGGREWKIKTCTWHYLSQPWPILTVLVWVAS